MSVGVYESLIHDAEVADNGIVESDDELNLVASNAFSSTSRMVFLRLEVLVSATLTTSAAFFFKGNRTLSDVRQ